MSNKNEKKYIIDNSILMAEWDWEKNNKLGLYPDQLTYGSSKNAWWKCSKCGYEWKTKISHRSSGTGCRKCLYSKLTKPTEENNLLIKAPELSKEWNFEKNKDKPSDYCINSNKKVWWKCSKCEHEWQAVISHRYSRKQDCPACSNKVVVFGKNDLFSCCPDLLKEWNYERNNLLGLDPKKISVGSHKKAWWKCSICGYEWHSIIYTRTKKHKENCPQCAKEKQISFAEKTILFYLKKIFDKIKENEKFAFLQGKELDIFVPNIKLAIEYDGAKWHKDPNRDLKKDVLCEKNKILLIRVREKDCPQYESSAIKLIVDNTKNDFSYLNKVIQKIVEIINNRYNYEFKIDINIERDYNNILQLYFSKRKEKSIITTSFFTEWNYEKNKGIDPKYVSINSNKKFWWVCKKGHEWQASPAKRSLGRNCPYCSNQKVLVGYNDLMSTFPNIAKEWDYNKNNLKPTEITAKTNKKYWWICSKCGNEWFTSVYVRTVMSCGCPNCKKERLSKKSKKQVKNKETQEVFDSIKEASSKFEINPSAISNCCRGITKTAGGYHWEFVKE